MMDIDKALAELRAAFPRVAWTAREDGPGSWDIKGGGLLIFNFSGGWTCQDKVAATPLLAVRAWIAAQPTAAFYPEAPSGETVEVRGWASVSASGETALCNSPIAARAYLDDVVAVYPVVIRVPVPVDPPVLVGEVSDV